MATSSAQKISAQEAKQIIENDRPIILDVRSKEEYESGHIPGAINFPVDAINVDSVFDVIGEDKQREMVVYCKAGVRSAMACDRLSELGYKNIFDMTGGIMSWPYETIKGAHPGRERSAA